MNQPTLLDQPLNPEELQELMDKGESKTPSPAVVVTTLEGDTCSAEAGDWNYTPLGVFCCQSKLNDSDEPQDLLFPFTQIKRLEFHFPDEIG